MRTAIGRGVIGLVLAMAGCATAPPQELVDARTTYRRASEGPAATLVPDELHKANSALATAERAFADDPSAQSTRDLAYVAVRKAQLAEAKAGIARAERDKGDAANRYRREEAGLRRQTEAELQATRQQLATEEQQHALDGERRDAAAKLATEKQVVKDMSDKLTVEQQARADAEQRAADALQKLEKIAATKQDERGLVITLSGSVLFSSGQATLLGTALGKLDQVAAALQDSKQNVVVEGHTDSRGSDRVNQDLSLRRAQAVRDYLVTRGIAPERCHAVGFGKDRPIADNATAEGRAENRRVEIVLQGRSMADR